MKKILSVLLVLLITTTLLCACNSAVIYEEETAINAWLKQRTQGYGQVSPSSRMILFRADGGFTVRIDTGSDLSPKLTVEDDETNTVVQEKSILTATSDTALYAIADHARRVFDPYKKRYTYSMQVWQKDASTFRIFFWLYGEDTDFYPIPKLLTADQYTEALALVEQYNVEQQAKSEVSGEKIVDYTGDFINLYKAAYFSEKAKNPKGEVYYECVGVTEYASAYRTVFAKMGLSEQDWRNSFEDLGYTGQKLNLQIVYCDVSIGKDTVDMILRTDDAYTSALLKSKNLTLTYSFCPTLKTQDYVNVEIK